MIDDICNLSHLNLNNIIRTESVLSEELSAEPTSSPISNLPAILTFSAEQQIQAPATKKGRFKFKSVNDVAAGLNRKRKAPPTNSPPTSATAESGGGGDVEDRESAAFTRVCMIISSVMSTAVLVQQACMFTLELYSYLSEILILC